MKHVGLRKTVTIALVFFGVLLIPPSGLCLSDEDVIQPSVIAAVETFLSIEGVLEDDPESSAHDDLRRLRTGFDATSGEWVTVQTRDATLKVSLEDSRVIWASYEGRRPPEVPVEDEHGVPRTQEQMERLTVHIDQEEARGAALDFLTRHFGREAVDGLDLVRSELLSRGSHFAYVFAWREVSDENDVARGMRRVSVKINPSSGEIYEFHDLASEAPCDVLVDHVQARTVATSKVGSLMDFRISRLALVTMRRIGKEDLPVWAVTYEYTSPSGEATGAFYIDANSGEVLE